MRRFLYASLERAAIQTEWSVWLKHLLASAGQVDLARPETWGILEPLSKNVRAMRWLVRQIRCCNPVPPEMPREESVFYVLAAFCPDNLVLGYVIDTFRHYDRSRNGRGVVSCARIQSLVNRQGGFTHLNLLYNLIMGCVLREYALYVAPADRRAADPFLSGREFHALAKYLPDFRPFGFRERVLAARNKMAESADPISVRALARACCMSESAFRKRFGLEFGIPVSEWLRRDRIERIGRMLRDPDIPLWQVAESCGFHTASAFSDYCRRNLGESPGRIRRGGSAPRNDRSSEFSAR